MNERPEDAEAAAALIRVFDTDAPEPGESMSMADVRAYLVAQITRLLDRNVAMLMSILYRVDVAEEDVMRVITETAPAGVAGEIADLMIERQLQKIRIRRQYRENDPEG